MDSAPTPPATPSSPAAGSAATTSSAARRRSGRPSRASATRSGCSARAGWARRASSRSSSTGCSAVARPRSWPSTGTSREAGTPGGWLKRCCRASKTPKRSAAPPTSEWRTWRACPSRRCSPRSCGGRYAAAGGCCCWWTRRRSCSWLDAPTRGSSPACAAWSRVGPTCEPCITATRLLARIDEEVPMPTSPFLQGFIPPVYLTPLTPDEGRTLLARGAFAAGDVELVLERTGRHPFLLQLLASRLFESRDLAATLDQLAADEMIANYLHGRLRYPARGRARPALRGGARGNADPVRDRRARWRARRRISRRRSTGFRCWVT